MIGGLGTINAHGSSVRVPACQGHIPIVIRVKTGPSLFPVARHSLGNGQYGVKPTRLVPLCIQLRTMGIKEATYEHVV